MTEKILVPVLKKEQKIELFNKINDVEIFLPSLPSNYRWALKISKDTFVVFELELQKKELLFWKRSVSYWVSLDMLKKDSVEECLKKCADSLLEMEEDKLLKNQVPQVNWINED